jgi:diacylglycerol kinase (ATP)
MASTTTSLSTPPSQRSSTGDRVLILVNPKAGARSSHSRVEPLVHLLGQRGLRPEVFTDLAAVAQQATATHAQGRLRALVAVGGDGTAAELVNRTAAGVPLALLPAGNENLLARYLGFDGQPESLCRAIAEGDLCQLDAAKANGRIFLLMLGCGFDAAVVKRLHDGRTGHVCNRSYVKPILQTVRTYDYPELQVDMDQQDDDQGTAAARPQPSLRLRWLFAFNLPCYGGGLRLCRRANAGDGLLDVCGFRRGSTWQTLRYAAAVLLGWHERLADCVTCRTPKLRITSTAEVPYQLDGDPGGVLPVEVEVLPGRLTMIVPKEISRA